MTQETGTQGTDPREYQHLLHGPRFAWWRPPLATSLVFVFFLAGAVLVYFASRLLGIERGLDPDAALDDVTSFTLLNVLLALLIPACMLATRAAYRDAKGSISSVARGVRWPWLWRCFLIAGPVFIVYVALDVVLDPPEGPGPAQPGWMLLAILAGTPLQAAGEEYLFRGFILQNVGAWFRDRRVALGAGTAVSTVVFVAAHGSADPWIMLDLAITAVVCCLLAARTGGLEAPIALHALNNVVGMVGSVVFGGWAEGFVDEHARGTPLDPLMTLAACVVAYRLLARRAPPPVA